MNIGLYQSASPRSALERWRDFVSQNIALSQTTGFRKRTVNFSILSVGELHTDRRSKMGHGAGMPMSFPKVNQRISFMNGETQPIGRALESDVPAPIAVRLLRPNVARVLLHTPVRLRLQSRGLGITRAIASMKR